MWRRLFLKCLCTGSKWLLPGGPWLPQSGTRIWQKAIFKHALGTLRGMDIPVFFSAFGRKKGGFSLRIPVAQNVTEKMKKMVDICRNKW